MPGLTAAAVGLLPSFTPTAAGSSFDAMSFTAALALVTGLMLVLSYSTTQAMTGGSVEGGVAERQRESGNGAADDPAESHGRSERPAEPDEAAGLDPAVGPPENYPPWLEDGETDPLATMTTGLLLANVAITQGVFLVAVVGAAVLTGVPRAAMGLAPAAVGPAPLLVGVGLGVGLYVANEVGAAVAEGAGIEYDERLRSVLAPDSAQGWAALLGFVLPLVAVFEEVLFRAAMVGVLAAGFGLSPWLLAVGSSLLFAAGHGLQGPAGVAVTGALGFVLAAAFVLTGSLVTVVVAHYLVNALEFGVHEGLGVEWV
ncbi:CPBP family intramembrane glutamic endopeptidase [Haloarchaeobius iranensis]|uniref:Membrane protease YdiL, CAAX protease family n=1 Tax=Haloarchaeobius iranensis TaxID=996166 RepID=A0A1G9TBS8_9EURY|nr:CPBP family intramembrane glutamic endopeptidase [Haloarchaeobius iranensis]SDM45074.1 Membrane protease YdiL, CAAX protease family [Haloarchaeobius iranensis]